MLALFPIGECTADKRSYGFRQYRGVQEVATYLKLVLGSVYAKRWVLEADIKGFYDNQTKRSSSSMGYGTKGKELEQYSKHKKTTQTM